MMKTVKHLLCCAIAASELSTQNSTSQGGGWSLSSLTNLLSSGNQALSADNMNNAAGIL